jgi:hypothetical protein
LPFQGKGRVIVFFTRVRVGKGAFTLPFLTPPYRTYAGGDILLRQIAFIACIIAPRGEILVNTVMEGRNID